MHVHPDIAALRSDRAPQRRAQSAMQAAGEAWRAEHGAGQMLEELADFGAGTGLEDCPQLEAVFTGQGQAERLTDLLSRHYCAAIAAHPYGHPPFRHSFDGRAASLLLARAGRAQLVIQTREPGSYQTAGHVFSDALRFDAVLGGVAQSRIVRLSGAPEDRAEFDHEAVYLTRGCRLALDLSSEALVVDRVDRRLVALRLLRTTVDPQPGREYDARSGALLHQSAGTLAISRQEATIALLGRMARADAAPTMADIALRKGDASLRWQALRECLALDSGAGFAALCRIARRADDRLAAAAGALRAQLLEAHPQLSHLEAAQCRV